MTCYNAIALVDDYASGDAIFGESADLTSGFATGSVQAYTSQPVNLSAGSVTPPSTSTIANALRNQ